MCVYNSLHTGRLNVCPQSHKIGCAFLSCPVLILMLTLHHTVGKLYYVKHYSDHSTCMQHSILYITSLYNKETDKNELTLVLSSPLDGRRIRKRWRLNIIEQVVQLNSTIKLVFCPACCKPMTDHFSLEFILFIPSNNATECLEFICQNPCFNLASSDERNIAYRNIEHDKVCLQKSQTKEELIAISTVSNNIPDASQIMSTAYENLVKETCDSAEEYVTTKPTELEDSFPIERPRAHTYEKFPFDIDANPGAFQRDDLSLKMQTPGTLHRSLVKVVEEDSSSNHSTVLPHRASHAYEEIPHKANETPGMYIYVRSVRIFIHISKYVLGTHTNTHIITYLHKLKR